MREALIAWLRQQPPETTFVYSNNRDCLVCRYLKDTGQAVDPSVGYNIWHDMASPDMPRNEIEKDLAHDLVTHGVVTYAEALAALEAGHG